MSPFNMTLNAWPAGMVIVGAALIPALDDFYRDRRELLADGTGSDLTSGRSREHGGLRRLT